MDSRESSRLLAALITSPAPEPGHSLAIETRAEELLITHPEAVQHVAEHPEIAIVITEVLVG